MRRRLKDFRVSAESRMEGKGNRTIELMSTRDKPVRDVVESNRMKDERIDKVVE
jgi:hypothetical protein